MFRFTPVIALFALACTPQSAKLEGGTITGYLSATNSSTVLTDEIAVTDGVIETDGESWNVDCRDLEDDAAVLALDNPLDICDRNLYPPVNEVWIDQGAYYAFREPLEPWRGEAILLNEGDLQIGFHHRVGSGVDFRWLFSIEPNFQPTVCDDDGEALELDGDWIQNWSTEIDRIVEMADGGEPVPEFLANAARASQGGRLYMMNAFSFQWDPDADNESQRPIWTLPEEWRSGFGIATLGGERMSVRTTRYADPELYTLFEADIGGGIPLESLFYGQCEDGDGIGDCEQWRTARRRARDIADSVRQQIALATPEGEATANNAELDEVSYLMPISHDNSWRVHDGRAPGLDGWAQLDYSWVMLTSDSEIEVGGAVHGFFQMFYEGDDSGSRIVVQGEFDVPSVRRERWGGPDLRAEKLEDAGLTRCQ